MYKLNNDFGMLSKYTLNYFKRHLIASVILIFYKRHTNFHPKKYQNIIKIWVKKLICSLSLGLNSILVSNVRDNTLSGGKNNAE